jgi:hypothetical protein
LIVAIGENIRFHRHCLSHDTLDGKSAAINLRRKVLDHDAPPSIRCVFEALSQVTSSRVLAKASTIR